ncbi:unnamed protein product, partial [Anisakis simplex]|uniref:Calponin-homology (CH) domain-containing protein n=1 Tax=Anisakis simplex TaxID=6269 RepID=A0A0M3KIA9_ANISI
FQNQARFSIDEAQEVLSWIEQVTNVQFPTDPLTLQSAQDVAEALKDGVQLCELMNDPNALPYNRNPKMPFHKVCV